MPRSERERLLASTIPNVHTGYGIVAPSPRAWPGAVSVSGSGVVAGEKRSGFFWEDTVYIDNKTDGIAQDHLANERTALAYLLTGLGMASAGIVLIEFFSRITHPKSGQLVIQGSSRLLGGAFQLLAIFVICIGMDRYFSVQASLQTGRFQPMKRNAYIINCCLGSLIFAAASVILSAHS